MYVHMHGYMCMLPQGLEVMGLHFHTEYLLRGECANAGANVQEHMAACTGALQKQECTHTHTHVQSVHKHTCAGISVTGGMGTPL